MLEWFNSQESWIQLGLIVFFSLLGYDLLKSLALHSVIGKILAVIIVGLGVLLFIM